jgi:AcrR family transcriptional regulator
MQVEMAPTRREREKLVRRQEMLDAAKTIFAEKGFDGATIEEIAVRAQFGKGTLYNYFGGGKEDILRAILDQMYEDLGQMTSEAFAAELLNSMPLRSLFRMYLVRVFRYYHEHLDVFLILIKEAYRLMLADEDRMSSYFSQQRRSLIDPLRPALEHGMATGQLRQLPVDAVGQLILGNIKGCQLHACLSSRGNDCSLSIDPEAQADLLTTILFDGMLLHSAEPADGVTE